MQFQDWLAEKVKLQSELQPTDPPVFSVSEAKEKVGIGFVTEQDVWRL